MSEIVSSATIRHLRGSAQKARLVVDLIRGKQVGEAQWILLSTKKYASAPIKKLLDSAVANAIDKKTAFLIMKEAGVPVPEFTTDINVARGWLDRRETIAVFCRTEVDAARGNGIVVARRAAELVPAPLYTKYVRKVHEYRIHAMKGEVFYVNKKQRRLDAPRGEQLVRSGREGWFFVHLDLPQWPNANARNAAGQAVAALGLDFGGVDVGVSEDGTATVYEVNTAPEIGRNTAAAYKAAFQQHYGQYNNNENVPIRNL